MNNNLTIVLNEAGWYKNRTIKTQIENTILYKIFPKKVQDFLCEFGNLIIHAEDKLETINTDTSYLNDTTLYNYYLNSYQLDKKIDLTKNNDLEYYYSTLIGFQLYPVADLIEQSIVLMDENGNFYVIDSLPQLIWISDETFDALAKITFGTRDIAIFNEHNLEWMAPIEKELNRALPINPILKKNPW